MKYLFCFVLLAAGCSSNHLPPQSPNRADSRQDNLDRAINRSLVHQEYSDNKHLMYGFQVK
jgi:hypothetical protein